MATAEACRKDGISDASFFEWKYGRMEASDARRPRALEGPLDPTLQPAKRSRKLKSKNRIERKLPARHCQPRRDRGGSLFHRRAAGCIRSSWASSCTPGTLKPDDTKIGIRRRMGRRMHNSIPRGHYFRSSDHNG